MMGRGEFDLLSLCLYCIGMFGSGMLEFCGDVCVVVLRETYSRSWKIYSVGIGDILFYVCAVAIREM